MLEYKLWAGSSVGNRGHMDVHLLVDDSWVQHS